MKQKQQNCPKVSRMARLIATELRNNLFLWNLVVDTPNEMQHAIPSLIFINLKDTKLFIYLPVEEFDRSFRGEDL